MPAAGEIFPGSSIAVVSLPAPHGLRIYFQDGDGNVREAHCPTTTNIWEGGTSEDIIFRAKFGTPLAATAWENSSVGILR